MAGITLLLIGQVCKAWAAPVDVFIMAGQSNATSPIPAFIVPDEIEYQPETMFWYDIDEGNVASNAWVDLGPISTKNCSTVMNVTTCTTSNKFGPEITFGHRINQIQSNQVAIIKVAKVGSNIRTDWNPESTGLLYDHMMSQVSQAMQNLQDQGHDPQITAFLWWQGEGDSGHATQAVNYEQLLMNFIESLRTDLNEPFLPFLFYQLHKDLDRNNVALARQSQQNVNQTIANTQLVNVDNFDLISDHVHFTHEARLKIGTQFADEWISFVMSDDFDGNLILDGDAFQIWQNNFPGGPRSWLDQEDIVGDFDKDGDVDGGDFLIWQGRFPLANGATIFDGDADGDGDVDGADYLIWQNAFESSTSQANVPEPGSIVWLIWSSILFGKRRRSHK